MKRVVLVDGHGPPAGEFGDVVFRSFAPGAPGDAYLAYHAPTPQLLSFPGPRAWYSTEPTDHRSFRSKAYRHYERNRQHFCFLHHSQRADFFVPMLTHYSLQPQFAEASERIAAAVAVVSNHGGRHWRLKAGERMRNHFILNDQVELFGSDVWWTAFRRWPWQSPAVPRNYRGNWTASYLEPAHIERLSAYRVALCLENSLSPLYFSEKFVNAVRAGCVPVYLAHPSVRETYLRGAAFVDPAAHRHDPRETVRAALALDRNAVATQNFQWLNSTAVQATGHHAVWSKIAEHFAAQFARATKDAQR